MEAKKDPKNNFVDPRERARLNEISLVMFRVDCLDQIIKEPTPGS